MKQNASSRVLFLIPTAFLVLALGTLESCAVGILNTSSSNPAPTGTGSISGTVADDSTNEPVAGAIVQLEQPDVNRIDRVLNSATTASDGSFTFSNLASGNYDVVVAASVPSTGGATITYATTITFLVPIGSTLNGIPLVPEFGNAMPNGLPVNVGSGGLITASNSGPVQIDVKLSALQSAGPSGSSPVQVTIPTFAGSTPEVSTSPGPSCPSATACTDYALLVPSSAPVVGTFSISGTSYTNPTQGPMEVIYTIEGRAFVHGNASMSDCVPSAKSTGPVVPRGTLASYIPNLSFTGCT
jgi:hypothetical protein